MLADDLTYKQFLFCEAYLRHFNADQACREAYPNMNSKNGSNVLKSRKVLNYLKKRLEEKKATVERLTDKAHEVMLTQMASPDPEIALEATKLWNQHQAKMDELEAKLKSLEAAQKPTETNVTIKYEDHSE